MGWLSEISVYVDNGKVTIRTTRGHDWTARFPAIASALAEMNLQSAG